MDTVYAPGRAQVACRPPAEHEAVRFHWLHHAGMDDTRPVEWLDKMWLGPFHVASAEQLALEGWAYLAPAIPPIRGG